ncbi:hypothetical protein B0I35DRAFT_400840 [Stachybotrys elegans]|uniref:Uncharacterized protein n=1 Tax=Stachybotrys elegans TaxID=80388 RepID=A0A8K0SDS3_9HYPO|nr:hypothetical protein B0I35DRAFT_400840 [Stachybotrys elegans]
MRAGVPWKTGIWTRFPFWGFGSWCLAVISTIVGVIVLVVSDGVPVDNWDSRLQPNVWLSLTATLTGALLAHAFTEAAAISWWRKATGPTSLAELHSFYQSSNNLLVAALNLFRGRTVLIGLASVVMTLSAVRGPLIQRASLTQNIYQIENGTMSFHIAEELPDGYGAITTGRTKEASFLTRNFSDIAHSYSNRARMVLPDTHCHNCTAKVRAFGFKVNCTSSEQDFNLDIGSGDNLAAVMDGLYVFQVNITSYDGSDTWTSKDGAFIQFKTLYKDTTDCKGKLSLQSCDLHAGISRIKITVDDDHVSLDGTWKDDEFLETRYMMPLGMQDANILGGFTTVISAIYESSTFMRFTGARGWSINTKGLPANQYMTQNSTMASCADTWANPMDDLIEIARELGFRASLQYAKTNNSDATAQQVEYQSGVMTLVFLTDYSRLAIALLVSFVGIFVVLPVFWGWWELGRNVTMNPLEVASAFERMSSEGSIFKGTDPNANADEIVKHANAVGMIRYGVLEGKDGVRLGFAKATTVRSPKNRERFAF